jgi:hypothetical protein
MTLPQLTKAIDSLPFAEDRVEARYLRDERLAILGCCDNNPTEAQVAIVADQLGLTSHDPLAPHRTAE